ncbi:hypothetical protein Tco_1569965 [Tanacetum coccineum]
MDIQDEIVASKGKLKVDSSSTKAEDASDEDEEVVFDEDGNDVDERISDEKDNDVRDGDSDEEYEDYEAKENEEDKESEYDKESEEVKETNKAEEAIKNNTKGKKKDVLSKSKKWKDVSLFEQENVSKTVPFSLFSSIYDSQVDMKSFLSNFGFSSLQGVFIDTIPSRLARFVVRAFTTSTYEFKLDKGIIPVTTEKINGILGVPLSGTSIFDLLERSLNDEFVKLWFKQSDLKALKDICASDIAKKLVLARTIDFMFIVNFLMLFTNVMGTVDTMKVIVNLTVLRRIREDINVAVIDWCGFILSCLQHNALQNTINGFYIGPLTFLILMYFDSTKFERFLVIRLRPAIQNWTTTAMNLRQELEIQEEVIGVFKETILLGEDQVHVDDFHPGDGEKVEKDDAGEKVDPVKEKQTMVEAKDVVEDDVNEAQ